MQELSTTQKTNYVAIAGVVVLIASKLGVNVQTDDILTLIGAVTSIWGIAANYYHRYKKGDLTLGGYRK